MPAGVDLGQQLGDQHVGCRWCFVGIGDAQAATQIQVVQGDPRGFNRLHEVQHTVQCIQVGRNLRDLRANMAVNAHHLDAWQLGGALVSGHGHLVCDAELVALEPGRDVGVRSRVHIRVHAQAHPRRAANLCRHLRQHFQLGRAFHVEAAHASLQALLHLTARLAHPGEHHLARIAACCEDTLQLTARYDVKPAACLGEGLQHRQVGVGLHGEAHQVRAALQCLLVGGQCRQHGAARIHIQRGAMLACQVVQREVVHEQVLAAIGQKRGAGECHLDGGVEG